VLSDLARQPVTVIGSGRTDSGVHATGQVISFTISWQHREDALQRALNANLPEDIVILQLETAASDFHPRFDARRRAYLYQIYNSPIRSPLKRQYYWHVTHTLDLTAMNEAAALLVGRHDFATFGQPPQGENSVREVLRADWQQAGEIFYFRIEANAFLYRMVRSLVGSLKLVGDGSWTVADFGAALAACDRRRSATVAPAQGLYLVSVWYD
jgi:tRNA pseudouridine38-40 synthase